MSDFEARIVQGDDVDLDLTVLDKDDNIIPLTGVIALTFKAKLTIDGQAYIEKSLGAGVSIIDAALGQVLVALYPTDTNISAGNYLFEYQITDSAGKLSTVRDFNDNLGCLTILADLDN